MAKHIRLPLARAIQAFRAANVHPQEVTDIISHNLCNAPELRNQVFRYAEKVTPENAGVGNRTKLNENQLSRTRLLLEMMLIGADELRYGAVYHEFLRLNCEEMPHAGELQ